MPDHKLNLPGKEYLCFKIDRETARTEYCARSRSLIKLIDLILGVESFEHNCVILKGCFQ